MVTVKDNSQSIINDITIKASIFLRTTMDFIDKQSEPRTPKKFGNLRRDKLKQVLGLKGKIVWRKKYASKMEQVQFANYTTAGTGPRFAEKAVKKAVSDTQRLAKAAGLI